MAAFDGVPGGPVTGTVWRSPRAKKVRLVVDGRGLTVVVPRAFRVRRELEPLLDRHLEWILRSLDKVRLRVRDARQFPVPLPDTILLPALGETWHVEASGARDRVSARDGVIRLPGDFSRTEALMALRNWLRLRARDALPPLLLELAMDPEASPLSVDGPSVARVFVKDMRSQWGSCSSRRNINLNSRLLFLPMSLVRHVMLHELCHLLEMNHGAAFYAHLRAADPEADRHRSELRAAWSRVPAWASAPLGGRR